MKITWKPEKSKIVPLVITSAIGMLLSAGAMAVGLMAIPVSLGFFTFFFLIALSTL